MSTTRQNKVARLLQKELGDIFQRESMNMFRGALISVTVVRIKRVLLILQVIKAGSCIISREGLLVDSLCQLIEFLQSLFFILYRIC